jgi:RecB family endonuclease NucS
VELKKARGPDKVFGQLSRYMAWVKKNLANGKDVAGLFVAKKIDRNLKMARDAHATNVTLMKFEMKIGSRPV